MAIVQRADASAVELIVERTADAADEEVDADPDDHQTDERDQPLSAGMGHQLARHAVDLRFLGALTRLCRLLHDVMYEIAVHASTRYTVALTA